MDDSTKKIVALVAFIVVLLVIILFKIPIPIPKVPLTIVDLALFVVIAGAGIGANFLKFLMPFEPLILFLVSAGLRMWSIMKNCGKLDIKKGLYQGFSLAATGIFLGMAAGCIPITSAPIFMTEEIPVLGDIVAKIMTAALFVVANRFVEFEKNDSTVCGQDTSFRMIAIEGGKFIFIYLNYFIKNIL
jgi:hypothetical protein